VLILIAVTLLAIRGGKEAEYQGRKKRKTTNALYLSD
jgi:hypothetical protein